MKTLLVISLILVLAWSWKMKESTDITLFDWENQMTGNLKSCSSTQMNTAASAITNCQVSSTSDTASCISNYMTSRINQSWDVLVREYGSTDMVSIWVYNSCYVAYNNYGRYSRYYLLWPAATYAGEEVKETKEFKEEASSMRHSSEVQIIGDCLSSRVSAVYAAISACDSSTNSASAQCVTNKMQSSLGEYWNTWASTYGSAISYWYYNECAISIRYGTYNRYYGVWKANNS